MKQINRIIVPTGVEEPPAAPHFDEEATLLSARPVVPLNQSASGISNIDAASYSFAYASAKNLRWMIVVLSVAAISLGVAGGLALSLYKNRQRVDAPAAVSETPSQQPATKANAANAQTASGQTIEAPPSSAPPTVASDVDLNASATTETKKPTALPETTSVTPNDAEAAKASAAQPSSVPTSSALPSHNAKDAKKASGEAGSSPTIRDKKDAQQSEDNLFDNASRDQIEKRERQRRVHSAEGDVNTPRQTNRVPAQRGADHIQDIFEGARP
jgi:hypothetical protein